MIEKENTMWTVKRSKRGAVLASVVMCALALLTSTFVFIAQAQHSSSVAASTTSAQTERVTIAIEGMHCGSCASGIKAMLKRTAGVISTEVSYERKEAVVEYEPGRVTREKIVEVIANMGYKANVKS